MIDPEDNLFDQDGEESSGQPEEQRGYSGEEQPGDPSELASDQPVEDTTPVEPGQAGETADFKFNAEEAAPEFDYSGTEAAVAAFHRELDALHAPSAVEPLEEEPAPEIPFTPRRRRKSLNLSEVFSTSDLGERLQSITQRTAPNVDFFVFSVLCGLILGIGYLLDAPAILLIGVFTAPILGPLVGSALSATTGEFSLFRLSFGGLLIGLALVFLVGILAGFAARFFQAQTFTQAFFHAKLWWPDLLMLILGTAVLVISYIQTDEKPVVASLMVVYEIYLPVSAAGFGLGSNIQGLWPQAGVVFLIHLALALIINLVIFYFMGFRPLENGGYAMTAGVILIGVIVLARFSGFGSQINVRGDQAYATALAAPTATHPTPTIQTPPSQTPAPVIAVPTLEQTPTPSITPSLTLAPPPPSSTGPVIIPTLVTAVTSGATLPPTLVPTPVYGRVLSPQSDGVLVRVKPGGSTITTVQNGYLAQIMGDKPVVLEGLTWIHVIITTPRGDIDGWVIRDLIVTATPSFSP